MNNNIFRCETIISAYEPESNSDFERLFNAIEMLNAERVKTDKFNNGLYGDIFELLGRASDNKNVKVATQGKADGYKAMNGRRRAVEFKTQDGRIGFLYNGSRVQFVVYQCFITEKHHGVKTETPSQTVIMTKAQFKQAVKEYATVSNHTDGEPFIRVNKKWYNFINNWYIPYDRNETYTIDDFDGLEI